MEEILNNRDFAALLKIRPQTARKWRMSGKGPSYFRIGNRVLYRRQDVMAWLEKYRRRSTADREVKA